MPRGDFYQRVYEVVRQIPQGRVTSYGAIAKYLGASQSARMVGWALNNCSNEAVFVPAHRVVNRNGLLTGKFHFPGSSTMEELLKSEGVLVENNQIIDFKSVFWDPYKEII